MKLFLYFPTAQFTNGRATDRPSFEPGTCQSDRCYSGSMGQQTRMAYNFPPSIHQALHPTCLGLSLIDFHTSSPTTNFSSHTPQTDLPPRLSHLHSPLCPLLDNKQPTSFSNRGHVSLTTVTPAQCKQIQPNQQPCYCIHHTAPRPSITQLLLHTPDCGAI